MLNKGTPKTLEGAIQNGIDLFQSFEAATVQEGIRIAVKDYLAQRFGQAMLLAKDKGTQEALKRLWAEIEERG